MKTKGQKNDWWVVCKIKAKSTIELLDIAYQEDEVTHTSTINIDDNLDNLSFNINENQDIHASELLKINEDMSGEDDYESEFMSSSKDNNLE